MSKARIRSDEVQKYIEQIKQVLAQGVTRDALEKAALIQQKMSARTDLFSWEAFPLPDRKTIYRTILIHQDLDGGYALYVNTSWPGQESPPHDHGGSWAIVTAVEGCERHKTYLANELLENDGALIRETNDLEVNPDQSVALMPDDIHSIHAETEQPLLHLHLYGQGYEYQGERRAFDLEANTCRRFVLDDIGFVEDGRS